MSIASFINNLEKVYIKKLQNLKDKGYSLKVNDNLIDFELIINSNIHHEYIQKIDYIIDLKEGSITREQINECIFKSVIKNINIHQDDIVVILIPPKSKN